MTLTVISVFMISHAYDLLDWFDRGVLRRKKEETVLWYTLRCHTSEPAGVNLSSWLWEIRQRLLVSADGFLFFLVHAVCISYSIITPIKRYCPSMF